MTFLLKGSSYPNNTISKATKVLRRVTSLLRPFGGNFTKKKAEPDSSK
jgi:hypothetical protein